MEGVTAVGGAGTKGSIEGRAAGLLGMLNCWRGCWIESDVVLPPALSPLLG